MPQDNSTHNESDTSPPSAKIDLAKFARKPSRAIVSRRVRKRVRVAHKPPSGKFIRVRAFHEAESYQDCEHCFPINLIKLKIEEDGRDDEKTYYVLPESELYQTIEAVDPDMLLDALLVVGITYRSTEPFVWELIQPDGRNEMRDRAAESRMEFVADAVMGWVKPKWAGTHYDAITAEGDYADPDWDKFDSTELFQLAINEKIGSLDNAEIKEALGL